jgi:hypothetical protein
MPTSSFQIARTNFTVVSFGIELAEHWRNCERGTMRVRSTLVKWTNQRIAVTPL